MSKSDDKQFQCKTYSTKQGKLIAACDAELIGKSFSQGKTRLEINENFYAGDRANFNAVKEELEAAKIANLVGAKLISRLVEAGYLAEEEIKRVDGVPHSQVFVV